MKIDLKGKWEFRKIGDAAWKDAVVPGCNYTDLLALGEIPDPFDGMNEKAAEWVYEADWEYRKVFSADSELLNREYAMLHADMLDTLADIYVNAEFAGSADNCHIAYDIDIKPYLKEGDNEIRVVFRSPVKYIRERQAADAMPHNNMGITGVPHIRKPQCHFGWDWGPILPASGISRDIYVHAYDGDRIDDVRVTQTFSEGYKVCTLDVYVATLNGLARSEVTLETPNGKRETRAIEDGKCTFTIEDPELWQTNDLSDAEVQPLYRITASLPNGESKSIRIGLRELKLDRSEDEYGRQFRFILNGVPIFAKGGNWIPADSFITRFTPDKIDYFLKGVRDSNMNMLRIWGGGYYESEEFYDKCDEYGILVWQDMMFACAPYPFYDEDFLANVKKEIEYNVKRLRNRACLALWCGNNEIEMMTIGWITKRELVKWTETFFHNILPDMMKELDGITPYFPGSPNASGFMKDVNSDKDGDTHLWHVWHGLQPLNYYRKRYTRFCSEFGLESLPDMRTIRGFAKPEDYSLKSDVFMAHQKCMSGNNKMLFYMSTRFRIAKKFEDIVYLTQVIQEECVKDATEHWRRNRGRCNGSLWWQVNDCWPVSSWSSIDYEGRYKALQYCSKHFNAPISVSLEDDGTRVKFYILNDKNRTFSGKLTYMLVDFNGKRIKEESMPIAASATSSSVVCEYDFKRELKGNRNCALIAVLYSADGNEINRKTMLFAPEKKLRFPKAKIERAISVKDGVCEIKLKASAYARYVKIEIDDTYKPLSDNFFDLPAGEEKTVRCEVPREWTVGDVEKRLGVVSLCDVEPRGGRLGDFFTRLKIRLIPINIANWIYYYTV